MRVVFFFFFFLSAKAVNYKIREYNENATFYVCCRPAVIVAPRRPGRDGGSTRPDDYRTQAGRHPAHRVRDAVGGARGVDGDGLRAGTGDRTALRAPAVDVHEARIRVDDRDDGRARLRRGRRRRGGGVRGDGGKGAEAAGEGTDRARRDGGFAATRTRRVGRARLGRATDRRGRRGRAPQRRPAAAAFADDRSGENTSPAPKPDFFMNENYIF